MAPAVAMKRASIGGGAQSKRSRKGRVDIAEQCREISAELQSSTAFPEAVLKMLSACLLPALSTGKETRHEQQERVVSWVGEALEGRAQKLEEDVVEAQSKVSTAKDELELKKAAVTEKEGALDKAVELLAGATQVVSDRTTDLATQESALADAERAKEDGERELESASALKATAEQLLSGPFQELKASVGAKKAIASLVSALKKEHVEDGLLASAPVALAREASARTDFDQLVLDKVEEAVKSRIAELEKKMSSSDEVKANLASAVEQAEQARSAATGAKDEAKAQHADAQAAVKAAERELKDAKKEARAGSPAVAAAEAELKAATKLVDAFKSGPLSTFAQLRERSDEVPEAAENEVPADQEEQTASKDAAADAAAEVTAP